VPHELDTEEYQEKAALYALGALSQHEARAFERHLAEGCSACESELMQFEKVAGTLGLGEAADPPAYLRDMLLSRIERELQTPAQNIRATGGREKDNEQSKLAAGDPGLRRSSPGRVILPWAIAASLMIVALASLFALSRAGSDADRLRAQLDAERNNRETLQSQVNRERTRITELSQINEVLGSPGHREIALSGQPPAPSSSAKVYWDTKSNRWIVTADLPQAPRGKVYQLWFVTANAKVSAGLMQPDESGHAFAVAKVPPDLGPIAAAAITLEPEGGSEQPTMPIYALGAAG
jgi:anti-sigma-K factor RskA